MARLICATDHDLERVNIALNESISKEEVWQRIGNIMEDMICRQTNLIADWTIFSFELRETYNGDFYMYSPIDMVAAKLLKDGGDAIEEGKKLSVKKFSYMLHGWPGAVRLG